MPLQDQTRTELLTAFVGQDFKHFDILTKLMLWTDVTLHQGVPSGWEIVMQNSTQILLFCRNQFFCIDCFCLHDYFLCALTAEDFTNMYYY